MAAALFPSLAVDQTFLQVLANSIAFTEAEEAEFKW